MEQLQVFHNVGLFQDTDDLAVGLFDVGAQEDVVHVQVVGINRSVSAQTGVGQVQRILAYGAVHSAVGNAFLNGVQPGIQVREGLDLLVGDAKGLYCGLVPDPVVGAGGVLIGGDSVNVSFVGNAFPQGIRSELFQFRDFGQVVLQSGQTARFSRLRVNGAAVQEHDVEVFAALDHGFHTVAVNTPVQIGVITGDIDFFLGVFVHRVSDHLKVIGLRADLDPGKVDGFAGSRSRALLCAAFSRSFTAGAGRAGRSSVIAAASGQAHGNRSGSQDSCKDFCLVFHIGSLPNNICGNGNEKRVPLPLHVCDCDKRI